MYYKEEGTRNCVPGAARNPEKVVGIWTTMMWILMLCVCLISLCCGMFLYQYYLEYNDQENIYGSGVHRITEYNTALS